MAQKRTQRLEIIARIAAQQWSVITLVQLAAAGFSYDEVRGMVARGQLHPIYRGVYIYGRRRAPVNGYLLAAQLACGPTAYLTRRTALGYHRVCGQYLRKIEVTVEAVKVRKRQPPIEAHRTTVPPLSEELRHEGPLRIASVQRAMLELAIDLSPGQAGDLITDAIRKGKLNHDQMLRLLGRHAGHPGVATLTEGYRAYLPRPNSKYELELIYDRHAERRPWLPPVERNAFIPKDGVDWEVDRYYRDYKVGVEIDGRGYHDAHKDMEKDHTKAAKLLGLGITLLHVTDWRLKAVPDLVLDDLEAALEARGWAGRRAAA
jgi:Transcriptional regulator, AbiEi antitoxin